MPSPFPGMDPYFEHPNIIDYSQPPPRPDLTPEDAAWLEAHLHSLGVR